MRIWKIWMINTFTKENKLKYKSFLTIKSCNIKKTVVVDTDWCPINDKYFQVIDIPYRGFINDIKIPFITFSICF